MISAEHWKVFVKQISFSCEKVSLWKVSVCKYLNVSGILKVSKISTSSRLSIRHKVLCHKRMLVYNI